MRAVVQALMNDHLLDPKHRDPPLSGDYAGVRECHIGPDWLLVYDKNRELEGGSLKLIRTGSQSDLF